MIGVKEEGIVLNGLVAQGSTTGMSGNASVSFSCFGTELALFTAIPNVVGNGGVEVSLSGYSRVPLTGFSISGALKFGAPASWDSTDMSYKISNTAPIQMHAIDEDEQQTEEVLGFGIYAKEGSSASQGRLIAWGPLVDANGDPVVAGDTAPVLTSGDVPVFYAGDFSLAFSSVNGGLDGTICIGLLNTLVQQGSTSPLNGVTQFILNNLRPQLALFTALPDAEGVGAVEVPTEIEAGNVTVETGYTRKALWGPTPTSGAMQFNSPAGFSGTDLKVKVENTDEVQLSAILPEITASFTVIGFGIYTGAGTLIAWGPLVDANGNPVVAGATAPVLTGGSVPIFYAGNFKLLLGGDATGALYVPVSSVTLDESSAEITTFTEPVELTATVSPSNATITDVTWESSDPDVAKVDAEGVVTAGSARGTAIITAFAADNQSASCAVVSDTATPTSLLSIPAIVTIPEYDGQGEPPERFIARIEFAVVPSAVSDDDKELTFSLPTGSHQLRIVEKDETAGTISVYSDTAGLYTITARVAKKPSIMTQCEIQVIGA